MEEKTDEESRGKIYVKRNGHFQYIDDIKEDDYVHVKNETTYRVDKIYENEEEARKAGYNQRTSLGCDNDWYNMFVNDYSKRNFFGVAFKTNEELFKNKTKGQLYDEFKNFIYNFRYENNMIEGHLNLKSGDAEFCPLYKCIKLDDLCYKLNCTERELGIIMEENPNEGVERIFDGTLIRIDPIKREYIPKYCVSASKTCTEKIPMLIIASFFLLFLKQGFWIALIMWGFFFFEYVPKINGEINESRRLEKEKKEKINAKTKKIEEERRKYNGQS